MQGADAELEQAARDFGLSALALSLLAAYLHEVPGHPVSGAAAIPDLDVPEAKGRHARRVMVAFEQRFGEGPEVELLRILGLFDRPAERAALDAVAAAPPIPGLTEHAGRLSEADWLRLLARLRRLKLIAPEGHHRPDVVDAHPLVREHFGEQLQREGPGRVAGGARPAVRALQIRGEGIPRHDRGDGPALRGGRARLPGRPAPGGAGRGVLEADSERGNEHFSSRKLGAFGADLAALSGFFDPPWRRPVDGLTEADKGFVLNEAGFDLRALGRLADAVEPMRAAAGGRDCSRGLEKRRRLAPATSASCPWRPATWPGPSATRRRASSWPTAAATPSSG